MAKSEKPKPYIQMLLAANLKRARGRVGYSQAQLAERTGLSTSFIAQIEVGRRFPSPQVIDQLVTALGLKPYELFLDPESNESISVVSAAKLANVMREALSVEVNAIVEGYLESLKEVKK